jgi:hypothetical protein
MFEELSVSAYNGAGVCAAAAFCAAANAVIDLLGVRRVRGVVNIGVAEDIGS